MAATSFMDSSASIAAPFCGVVLRFDLAGTDHFRTKFHQQTAQVFFKQ